MQDLIQQNRPENASRKRKADRRARGLRCISCGSARCELTVHASETVFRCADCAAVWPERRITARLGPHCAPASEAVRDAVRAICRADGHRDLAARVLGAALNLTDATRVTMEWVGGSCYSLDRDLELQECARDVVTGDDTLPRHASLVSGGATHDIGLSGHLPNASGVAIVPIRSQTYAAVVAAYWQSPAAPTVWHVQTLELLAEAVRHACERLPASEAMKAALRESA